MSALQGGTTWGTLQERIARLRKQANTADFPTLIQDVSERLTKPLHFEKEFLSINKVRNCLEHRNGIVGKRDVSNITNTLDLSLPRLMLCCERNGIEVELVRGSHVEKDEVIVLKRVTRDMSYKVGGKVTFNSNEFQEIGMACWMFAQDLASKLPRVDARAAA